jgi:hypothetical protein
MSNGSAAMEDRVGQVGDRFGHDGANLADRFFG